MSDLKKKPDPKEFEIGMQILAAMDDQEHRHYYMDRLMANVLIQLGYEDGIKVFNTSPKWYA